jgi:SAM-dependent methyltransferase
MKVFYEAPSVPTNSCILMTTPEEARAYPRGDIRLGVCEGCGFISNVAFVPEQTEYSGRYEETQGFSGTFKRFHESLARGLIGKYDLRGKDILEIGCGKGEFISLLADLGDNKGVGFDPGYLEERNPGENPGRVVFIKEFFTEEHGDLEADLVCCKMTLEHIHQPQPLFSAVRRVASHRPRTVVFFQVPDMTRILDECAFEDIYYEHCSYYSASSLASLFRRFDFEVLELETVYGGQYLTIEAVPGQAQSGGEPGHAAELEEHLALVTDFEERCRTKLREWQERLNHYRRDGKAAVLWGSGSKGVSFLTTLETNGVIERVVDINPFRRGHFMPGTGQPIVAPRDLEKEPPDVVIILNRIYLEEISKDLEERGLGPEIVAL